MHISLKILVVAVVVLVMPKLAEALTLMNLDGDSREIVVFQEPDEQARTYVLAPAGSFKLPCPWSCSVSVENGLEMDVEGHEVLAIRRGELFLKTNASGQLTQDETKACLWQGG